MGDIFRAAREGNEEEVIRLLDIHPTLLEKVDNDRNTPLIVAARYRHRGLMRLLIERDANIHATGARGSTTLHYAALGEVEEVVAFLLAKGVHANSRDDGGVTPLMWACTSGNLCVVKMLYHHLGGQGLDEWDARGWTALHYATHCGHVEVVRFLLLVGADPTITDNEGMTPRAIAEVNPYVETIAAGRVRCVAMFEVTLRSTLPSQLRVH
jgi:ankyrin repeat protein